MDGLLIVDKARGVTSHDVVRLARRALRTRAVGHAGTLDPMATGVLVLGCGQATRLLRFLTADDKCYEGSLRLGVLTDSLDADGVVVSQLPVPAGLDLAHVRDAAVGFVGDLAQSAPAFSAIKRDGEALYRKARRGEQVEAPVRSVVCRSLEITRLGQDTIDFVVRCSKGFYVRALARDLAEALGTVGHLIALRRTASGLHTLADAVSMAALQRGATAAEVDDTLASAMVPLNRCVSGMAVVQASDAGVAHLRCGRKMPASDASPVSPGADLPEVGPDPVAMFSSSGQLVAIARREQDHFQVVRGFPAS